MVPKHGTCAILLRAATGQPQLLATSRHLTAAKSLSKVNWNEEKQILSGESVTVPGDKYSLYFYVPSGYKIKTNTISSGRAETTQLENNLLQLSFQGTEKPIEWSVEFSK